MGVLREKEGRARVAGRRGQIAMADGQMSQLKMEVRGSVGGRCCQGKGFVSLG